MELGQLCWVSLGQSCLGVAAHIMEISDKTASFLHHKLHTKNRGIKYTQNLIAHFHLRISVATESWTILYLGI